MKQYQDEVLQLASSGMLRQLQPFSKRRNGLIEARGRQLVNLSSNDYLGLAGNGALRAAFFEPLIAGGFQDHDRFGLGVASSRLLTGDVPVAHQLEKRLAELYGRPALLFNSGYHANIGILPALFGKRDLIVSDKLNHASLHDGLRICRADYKRFNHRDYQHVRALLEAQRDRYEQVIIVTESVFSMDGDCADLAELVALKREFDCLLYVDEAHAVGLYGENGLGIAERDGYLQDIDLLVGTFGKACGSVGAFVICPESIRDFLINRSRSVIFTTALPPIVLSWNLYVMERIPAMAAERQQLQQLTTQFREELNGRELTTAGSTNIVPVVVGPAELTVAGAAYLRDNGFLVMPVRPPTVPEGTSRFRLSLTADLTWDAVAGLPQLIETWLVADHST